MESFPPRPSIASGPVEPRITSLPGVPWIVPAPAMVGAFPLQVAASAAGVHIRLLPASARRARTTQRGRRDMAIPQMRWMTVEWPEYGAVSEPTQSGFGGIDHVHRLCGAIRSVP